MMRGSPITLIPWGNRDAKTLFLDRSIERFVWLDTARKQSEIEFLYQIQMMN